MTSERAKMSARTGRGHGRRCMERAAVEIRPRQARAPVLPFVFALLEGTARHDRRMRPARRPARDRGGPGRSSRSIRRGSASSSPRGRRWSQGSADSAKGAFLVLVVRTAFPPLD
jgi:hypothetical protein